MCVCVLMFSVWIAVMCVCVYWCFQCELLSCVCMCADVFSVNCRDVYILMFSVWIAVMCVCVLMFSVWIAVMCVYVCWCFQCELQSCVCELFSLWSAVSCHVCGVFRLSCCQLSNCVCECWCFQCEWVPVVQLAESAGGHSAHGAVPVWPRHQQVDQALHQAGWRHPHRGCGWHWTQCGGGEHSACCAEFWEWFCL